MRPGMARLCIRRHQGAVSVGLADATRIGVTEAAIDILSLAAIEYT
jgi:hypothetical protein